MIIEWNNRGKKRLLYFQLSIELGSNEEEGRKVYTRVWSEIINRVIDHGSDVYPTFKIFLNIHRRWTDESPPPPPSARSLFMTWFFHYQFRRFRRLPLVTLCVPKAWFHPRLSRIGWRWSALGGEFHGGGRCARSAQRARERGGGGWSGASEGEISDWAARGGQGPPTCSIECSVSHSAERARSGKAVGVRHTTVQRWNYTVATVLSVCSTCYHAFFLRMKKPPLTQTFKRLEFFRFARCSKLLFLSSFVFFPSFSRS